MLSHLQQLDSEIRGIFVLEVFSKRQESVVKIILVVSYCLKCVDHVDLVEASDLSVTNPNRGDIIMSSHWVSLIVLNCQNQIYGSLWFGPYFLQFLKRLIMSHDFRYCRNVPECFSHMKLCMWVKESILIYSFIF